MSKFLTNSLQRQIDLLVPTIKQYIPETCDVNHDDETRVTQVMIRGFDGIVATCKEELEDADEEHLKYVLLTMCQIDIDKLNKEELYESIDSFISHYINLQSGLSDDPMDLNEKNLIMMIQLKGYSHNMIKSLVSLSKIMSKNRWSRWKHKDELDYCLKRQVEIQTLLDALNARIEIDADKMIERIVENFYMIFIFLLSLSKLTQYRNDLVDRIAVISEIDRILTIIDPSLQGNTLKRKYLLYYHVVFELKEFRYSLLCEI